MPPTCKIIIFRDDNLVYPALCINLLTNASQEHYLSDLEECPYISLLEIYIATSVIYIYLYYCVDSIHVGYSPFIHSLNVV